MGELGSRLDGLAKDMAEAQTQIDRLTAGAKEHAEYSVATYATKRDVSQDCGDLKEEFDRNCRHLKAICDQLEVEKVSQFFFSKEREDIRQQHEELHAAHAETVQRLSNTIQNLGSVDRRLSDDTENLKKATQALSD